MFTKFHLLFLTLGIVVLSMVSFSSADSYCSGGTWCPSPSYCCGSACCSGPKNNLYVVVYATVFVIVLILLYKHCCKRHQGEVYSQGVVTQTAQTTYQPPMAFQQPLPPNVMYPAYQPMDSPYQQQYPANPYYPGAPPPYNTVHPTVPMPQPST